MNMAILRCIHFIGIIHLIHGHIFLQQDEDNGTISFRLDRSSMLIDGVERKPVLNHFTYKKCGSPDDPGKILKLQLKTTSYGDMVITASGSTKVELHRPITVKVEMKTQKLGTYIHVKCLHNFFGSCTFNDICDYGMTPCPFKHMQKANIPCACPVPAGMYSLSDAEFPVPTTRHAKVFKGKHMITANVYNGNGKRLACYGFNVTLA